MVCEYRLHDRHECVERQQTPLFHESNEFALTLGYKVNIGSKATKNNCDRSYSLKF